MNDRQRRLDMLAQYEAQLRERTAAERARMKVPVPLPAPASLPMLVHTLDLSNASGSKSVSWLEPRFAPGDSPEESMFFSMVEGRGELVVFGGIRGDSRTLQRINDSLLYEQPQHQAINDVYFLSFEGAEIR